VVEQVVVVGCSFVVVVGRLLVMVVIGMMAGVVVRWVIVERDTLGGESGIVRGSYYRCQSDNLGGERMIVFGFVQDSCPY